MGHLCYVCPLGQTKHIILLLVLYLRIPCQANLRLGIRLLAAVVMAGHCSSNATTWDCEQYLLLSFLFLLAPSPFYFLIPNLFLKIYWRREKINNTLCSRIMFLSSWLTSQHLEPWAVKNASTWKVNPVTGLIQQQLKNGQMQSGELSASLCLLHPAGFGALGHERHCLQRERKAKSVSGSILKIANIIPKWRQALDIYEWRKFTFAPHTISNPSFLKSRLG